jgi:hypothetical protein
LGLTATDRLEVADLGEPPEIAGPGFQRRTELTDHDPGRRVAYY